MVTNFLFCRKSDMLLFCYLYLDISGIKCVVKKAESCAGPAHSGSKWAPWVPWYKMSLTFLFYRVRCSFVSDIVSEFKFNLQSHNLSCTIKKNLGKNRNTGVKVRLSCLQAEQWKQSFYCIVYWTPPTTKQESCSKLRKLIHSKTKQGRA